MLSSSSCPVEHSQQLRWITLKGDHSFAEQFSYWLLLGEENEYEAWTLNGHASLRMLLQLWREPHRLRHVLLARTAGQAKAPASWLQVDLPYLGWLSPEIACEWAGLLHPLHKLSCDRWLQTRFSFVEARWKAWVQPGLLLYLHSTKCGFDRRATTITLRHEESIFTDGQITCFPILLFLSSFLLLFSLPRNSSSQPEAPTGSRMHLEMLR